METKAVIDGHSLMCTAHISVFINRRPYKISQVKYKKVKGLLEQIASSSKNFPHAPTRGSKA